jgi:amidophosphoribosyltransferase
LHKLVNLLRDSGVSKIHVRISSPQYVHGCYLGIDTPNKEKLLSYQFNGSIEAIQNHLGVDSIAWLTIPELLSNKYLTEGGHCTHCFDGIKKIKTS